MTVEKIAESIDRICDAVPDDDSRKIVLTEIRVIFQELGLVIDNAIADHEEE